MTWTVTSNKSVAEGGILPAGVEAAYTNTYNKGQVRANDTATLSLTHLSGITVERIEVYVKSNKSSGAGVFTVEANGRLLATISGTLAEWVGAYDNQDFHALTLYNGSQEQVHTLTVTLTGTANSLHLDKYVITYQEAPAYTVTFMSGTQCVGSLTEETGGAGVVLPAMPDRNEWQFVAWTPTPFYTVETLPDRRFYAEDTYYPTADITLWAVYEAAEETKTAYVTDLQPGIYLYLDTTDQSAITGVPVNGRMEYTYANVYDGNQYYEILFNDACDSATIQHVATRTYIGFEQTHLAAKKSVWCVYHRDGRTAFYTVVNDKQYILFPAVYHSSNGEVYADLLKTSNVASTPTALIAIQQELIPSAYTCYPETGRDLEPVRTTPRELIIPLGTYQLRISDGKKTIRL